MSSLNSSEIPEQLSRYGRDMFETLFAEHPKERGRVLVDTKNGKKEWREEECKRWMKSYLKTPLMDKENENQHSYMFSGSPDDTDIHGDVPLTFQPFVDWMQKQDSQYNQVVINWYNAEDLIPLHSDCELNMIPGHKISIISLYSDDAHVRDLHFVNRLNGEEQDVKVPHGSLVSMCGNMQKEFRHEVKPGLGPRISISFRQMI